VTAPCGKRPRRLCVAPAGRPPFSDPETSMRDLLRFAAAAPAVAGNKRPAGGAGRQAER
jgi:hypothetical protein